MFSHACDMIEAHWSTPARLSACTLDVTASAHQAKAAPFHMPTHVIRLLHIRVRVRLLVCEHPSCLRRCVDVGALVQEQPHHLDVPTSRCRHEAGAAHLFAKPNDEVVSAGVRSIPPHSTRWDIRAPGGACLTYARLEASGGSRTTREGHVGWGGLACRVYLPCPLHGSQRHSPRAAAPPRGARLELQP